jgi:hypothetical protein
MRRWARQVIFENVLFRLSFPTNGQNCQLPGWKGSVIRDLDPEISTHLIKPNQKTFTHALNNGKPAPVTSHQIWTLLVQPMFRFHTEQSEIH